MKYAKEDIEGLGELCKEDDLPSDMCADWAKGFYEYLCSRFYYDGTGIVFVGYGDDELFPSLIPIYVFRYTDLHLFRRNIYACGIWVYHFKSQTFGGLLLFC